MRTLTLSFSSLFELVLEKLFSGEKEMNAARVYEKMIECVRTARKSQSYKWQCQSRQFVNWKKIVERNQNFFELSQNDEADSGAMAEVNKMDNEVFLSHLHADRNAVTFCLT